MITQFFLILHLSLISFLGEVRLPMIELDFVLHNPDPLLRKRKRPIIIIMGK